MDLQPIAVMLELVRPARPTWRLLGDDRLARMNEGGRRILGPYRESYAHATAWPRYSANYKIVHSRET
jgi:hypothetical protein